MNHQTDSAPQVAQELLNLYPQPSRPRVARELGESSLTSEKALRLMELLAEMNELLNVIYGDCHTSQRVTALNTPTASQHTNPDGFSRLRAF